MIEENDDDDDYNDDYDDGSGGRGGGDDEALLGQTGATAKLQPQCKVVCFLFRVLLGSRNAADIFKNCDTKEAIYDLQSQERCGTLDKSS